MAITLIKELRSDRAGSDNNKNERTYSRLWLVVTDDPTDGPKNVEAAWVTSTGIVAGSSYSTSAETDTGAYALNIQTRCVSEDGLQWQVLCQYGPWDQQGVTSPTLQPYEVEWSFDREKTALDYDIYGQAICNSAGDPFLEPIEVDLPLAILSVERNEVAFSSALAWQYSNAVNATYFFGAPPGIVKVRDISSKRKYDSTWGFYWTTSYSFAFNSKGWRKIILDQGLRELDGTSGKKKNIMVQNTAVTEPVKLDGTGKAVPAGSTYAYWKIYDIYPRLPFTVFAF